MDVRRYPGTFAVTGDVCRYPGTFAVTRARLPLPGHGFHVPGVVAIWGSRFCFRNRIVQCVSRIAAVEQCCSHLTLDGIFAFVIFPSCMHLSPPSRPIVQCWPLSIRQDGNNNGSTLCLQMKANTISPHGATFQGYLAKARDSPDSGTCLGAVQWTNKILQEKPFQR